MPANPAPAALTEPVPTRREWLGLAVLAVGLGLIVLDGTIVGVALPTIISDLELNLLADRASWSKETRLAGGAMDMFLQNTMIGQLLMSKTHSRLYKANRLFYFQYQLRHLYIQASR